MQQEMWTKNLILYRAVIIEKRDDVNVFEHFYYVIDGIIDIFLSQSIHKCESQVLNFLKKILTSLQNLIIIKDEKLSYDHITDNLNLRKYLILTVQPRKFHVNTCDTLTR